MDAVARETHDDVSGPDRPAVHDLRLPHDAEAGAGEVELAHELRHNGDLPADDRDVRHLRSAIEPHADLAGDLAVVRLDRDIVDEGYRLRPAPDHVAHIRRDAGDAGPVPPAHLPFHP